MVQWVLGEDTLQPTKKRTQELSETGSPASMLTA